MKLNINFWKIASLIYAIVIFVNENFMIIQEFGLSTKVEKAIKVVGAVLYFVFTYNNFKPIKTTDYDNK